MLTPYQFASNSPIANSDLDGLEAKLEIYSKDKAGNVYLTTVNKNDLYLKTYKNGEISGQISKLSLKDFYQMASSYWSQYTQEKTAEYYVINFDSYRSNTSQTINGKSSHNPHSTGTLTLTLGDESHPAQVHYDNKVVKAKEPVTFKESYNMAMKAGKTFFLSPDPNVEGSQEFKQSFDNFVTGVTLPIGGQGVIKGVTNAEKIVSGAGVLNSFDDLTSNITSNGESLISNSAGGSQIKVAINLMTFIYGLNQLKSAVPTPNSNSTEPIDNVISTIGDSKSLLDNVAKNENKP
ncbi:MAG: hypothetical protein IPN79_04170 [Saprospiraceae bacterium]|nr:hypothetical protein [Saprospiraceae bacterium]